MILSLYLRVTGVLILDSYVEIMPPGTLINIKTDMERDIISTYYYYKNNIIYRVSTQAKHNIKWIAKMTISC